MTGQGEEDGAGAEERDAAEERAASVRLAALRELRQHEARRDGAHGEGAAQDAKARGPDLQDVARKHGQQRVDAAEQHREEIERDRAEHDRLRHQVAQPGEGARERRASGLLRRHDARADREHGERRGERHDEACAEGDGGAGEIDEAAERRAGDDRDLLRGGAPGDRLRELLARHEERRERLRRRAGERARGAGEHQRAVERPRRAGLHRHQNEQQGGSHRLDEVRGEEHEAPVGAVGEIACGQGEERDRQKCGEAGPAERHRIARQVVEVPADRHPLHIGGEHVAEPPGEKQREVPDREDVAHGK